MNPMGLVPVLQDGEATMFESNAIVRYLAARHGDGRLRPRAPKPLSLAEQWMDWTQLNLGLPAMNLFMQSVRTARDKQNRRTIEEAEAKLHELLPIADRAVADKAYVAGDELSFGDIPLGVFIWRLSCFDWQRPALGNLERWHERLKTRAAYRKAVMLPTGRSPEEWAAYEKQFA
jgi:glutathione S-transferase